MLLDCRVRAVMIKTVLVLFVALKCPGAAPIALQEYNRILSKRRFPRLNIVQAQPFFSRCPTTIDSKFAIQSLIST
ncbi:hypothetical protein BY458DRAFT_520364 [Sporodiniella umbellata]|nr:hypothetical protein BY458DRAFT_520364 [Sporodiniella umbellata]